MSQTILPNISERNVRVSLFLFFGLLFLSVAFFVSADETNSQQNIFQDSDQDGLSNDEEALYKTDPLNKDTDGDGYSDGVEVESGYDPLKPAPGDKIIEITGEEKSREPLMPATESTANLTAQVSSEIANMVQGSATVDGEDITLETVTEAVENVLSQADQEIVLPEINTDEIKIKLLSKKLKDSARAEQEKEDALEYLTVMVYILANNAPKKFQTTGELESLMTSLSMESLSAIALGNASYLENIATMGEKTLKEIKDVEVPEDMLDTHMKAIKMAKYSITLKDEVKTNGQEDPIGQIASFSKVQGFLGVASEFFQEINKKLSDYGIVEIPFNMK